MNNAFVPPGSSISAALRRYLYFTAAITGAAIMVVEILGAKMLSPYIGLSHFVWTSQIAVTLVALACGYYAGGRLADRTQRPVWLYWALLAASICLAASVLLCEPIAYWCLDFRLGLGALMASALLFFLPLSLMAMTAPFLSRVLTSSVGDVGGTVGRLTSLGTIGSFAGTLLIGYFLLPRLPNSVTMYSTALALMLVSGIYFGVFSEKRVKPLLAVLILSQATGVFLLRSQKSSFQHVEELFRGNSYFGQLEVVDRRDSFVRYYLNDNLIQNSYDAQQRRSVSTFTYMLSGLARAYSTNIQDVLCIGLGVGIVPMDFANRGARVDAVEINPAVIPVAQKFFGLDTNKLRVTIDDGRHFLNRCRKQYDVVVLDAFLGDSSPSHLLTREAFAAMRHVLRADGVLVINLFGSLEDGQDFLAASVDRTLKTVFSGVRMHTSGAGQIYFAATPRPAPTFLSEPDFSDMHPDVEPDARSAFRNVAEAIPGHGRVLTDDYNPTEYYDAHNREELRRRLALSAREM